MNTTNPHVPSHLSGILTVVGTYALFATLWIAFSDSLLGILVTDPAMLVRMSMVKGWFFVAVTTLLLYGLVRQQLNHLDYLYRHEEEAHSAKREALELLQAISDATDDAIFAKDTEGRYLFLNKGAADFFSRSSDELIGFTDYDIFPDDQAAMLAQTNRHIVASGESITTQEVLHTAHGVRTFVAKKGPLRNAQGTIIGTFGISHDITSYNAVKQQLQQTQGQLQLFIDHAPTALAMFDRDMRYLAVSRRWIADFGLGGESLIGKRHYDVSPNLPETYRRLNQRALNGEVLSGWADRYQTEGGNILWIDWEVRPWYEAPDVIGGIVVFSDDVTERKRAADLLAESEQRWRFAIDGSDLGLWDWNIPLGTVFFSSNWKAMFGYGEGEIAHTLSEWEIRVHPDDVAGVMAEVARHMKGETKTYSTEHRVRCKDGSYKWILDRGMIVERTTQGEPVRMIGTHTDLSAIRLAHQALEDSEQRYRQLFSANPAPMWVYDLETLAFMEVNDAAIAQYGYSRDEFLTMTIADIRPQDDVARLHDNIRQIAGKPNHYNDAGVWRHCRKDGRVIWVAISGHTIVFNGRNSEIILAQDVTARVEAEHQLRLSAKVYATSREGFMVTDPDHTIIGVNPAFTKITGFELDDVKGHKPSILSSGRHDAAFYQAMADGLARDQYWHGEIWNRRKTGEIYPQWMSITAVTDGAGAVENYVAVFSDLSEHKQAEEAILTLSFYDSLTGLANRRLLMDRLSQSLLMNARRRQFGAILFIDLDDFKIVNDTRGHQIGDLLLIEIARRIQSCVHADDTLARIDGDVFAVVAGSLGEDEQQAAIHAETIATRISDAVKQPLDLSGEAYYCKVCIGISLFSGERSSMEDQLKRVDAAMYQAKQNGKDNIHFFDTKMQQALETRVQLEGWLHNALPDQLRLYYQVQVNRHGQPFGAEVLLRWQHPKQGLISPAAFIPLAEESGLIVPIGTWIIETVCRQLHVWEGDAKTRHLLLAVNVSAKQFHQPDFVNLVLDILDRTGADPTRLKLELTESLLVENIDMIVGKMRQLQARGVRFSLDDFGTGFSSLSYLKSLPIDQLKIDQSFVRDVTTDPSDAAIVRTVIALGQGLGLAVIAEGVETEAQKGFLEVHGCTQYQGYLFSKPVPLEDFERLIFAA